MKAKNPITQKMFEEFVELDNRTQFNLLYKISSFAGKKNTIRLINHLICKGFTDKEIYDALGITKQSFHKTYEPYLNYFNKEANE